VQHIKIYVYFTVISLMRITKSLVSQSLFRAVAAKRPGKTGISFPRGIWKIFPCRTTGSMKGLLSTI